MYAARGRLIPFSTKSPTGSTFHGVSYLRQHPRTDEDLSWLGLIAKAGCDVGYGAYGGVVEAATSGDAPQVLAILSAMQLRTYIEYHVERRFSSTAKALETRLGGDLT